MRLLALLVILDFSGCSGAVPSDSREAKVKRPLVAGYQQLVVYRSRIGEDDLGVDLNNPCCALGGAIEIPPLVALSDVLRHRQPGVPIASRLKVWLELRHAVSLGRLDLLVRVEGGGICSDMDGVGAMEIGGSQRQSRGVAYANMQERRRREDAVFAGGVGDCVPA